MFLKKCKSAVSKGAGGGGGPSRRKDVRNAADRKPASARAPAPAPPPNTTAQTPAEANETTQNRENPFTDLRVSEVFFHWVIFGVAHATHPLDTLTRGQSRNLPKTSSRPPAEATRLGHYEHSWGAMRWAGKAEKI